MAYESSSRANEMADVVIVAVYAKSRRRTGFGLDFEDLE